MGFQAFILQKPKLAQMVGQAAFSVGGFWILCGVIGRAAMTALNQARGIGKMPPYSGLAEAYPMFSLWWVPERPVGYVVPILLAASGIYLAHTAKSALKQRRRG